MKKIPISAQNDCGVFKSYAHHLRVWVTFRTQIPKIKNLMTARLEPQSSCFWKVFVKQKVHATESYADPWKFAISAANCEFLASLRDADRFVILCPGAALR